VAARSIAAGTVIDLHMVAVRRPGTGLSPDQLDSIVGRRVLVDVPEGALFTREMLG
jgi:N-acetylneuraminate synthase